MSEELKPCPFCGGKPHLDDEDTCGIKSYYVMCDCGIQTNPFLQKERAIECWNRRVNEGRDHRCGNKILKQNRGNCYDKRITSF